jgi:hypothetical protein
LRLRSGGGVLAARVCVTGIADAIEQLSRSPELSEGARRAGDFEWPKPVVRVYDDIERRFASHNSPRGWGAPVPRE